MDRYWLMCAAQVEECFTPPTHSTHISNLLLRGWLACPVSCHYEVPVEICNFLLNGTVKRNIDFL